MTMPAARVVDNHVCPFVTGIVPHVGGPVSVPFPTVMFGKMPTARLSAVTVCVGPPDTIIKGSATVLVGGMPQARLLDNCSHGGMLVAGCFTVLVGG